MARVGFDGWMISPSGKGNARSERHAVEALAERGDHEIVVFVREPAEIEGAEVVQVDPRLTIDWELRGIPTVARRHRLDAFLTLSERLPLSGQLPIVVWLFESPVHRIRSNRVSGARLWNRASDLLTSALWKRSLLRAAHVAFGSEATRMDVLRSLPLSSTSVVYPGIPPAFGPGDDARELFVLHLGSDDPRDNTEAAVEACARVGARLVVVGGWSGKGAEALGRVSDEELASLYRRTGCFLDPTLYEGFGYGVLEAMASGAVVVASDTTSIPEVVGDAALLFDPRDPAAIAAALRRVLHEPGLANELRRRGLGRAAEFTWERTAAGLSEALAVALR